MPVYSPGQEMPDRKTVEEDFFRSRSFLAEHYGLKLTDYRPMPFPYNVLLAQRELNSKLKTKGRFRQLMVVEQDDHQICLTVTETFNRDFGMYYIPVMPVYDLWHKEGYRPCAELLTAVFAYLYAIAGIDYYRDEDTYMFRNYEFLEEWITEREIETDNEADNACQRSDYEKAKSQGDFIQEKMMANGFRDSLGELSANFCAVTDFERGCQKAAETAWRLWQDFPEANVYKHANLQGYEPEDYDDNYVGMHEYISFIGSLCDSISDDLQNMVNDDFNERARFQEPEIVKFFNDPQGEYVDELAYEERLFHLLDELCNLLYHKP